MLLGCKGGSNNNNDALQPADAAADGASNVDAAPDAAPDAGLPPGAPPIGSCRLEWCWVYPLPQGNALRAIWGASSTDVWIAGDRETLLRYHNASWTNYEMDVRMLWGTAANDVWAIGNSAVWRWNGTSWATSLTTGGGLIGGTGPNDVLALTSAGTKHWNGTAWSDRLTPTGAIALGGSPGSLMAVTSSGGIMKWLGAAWGVADGGSRPTNQAVVIDATHIVIAQDGAVQFWDGQWVTNSPPVSANWYAIAARAFDDVFVVGIRDGVIHRYRWNGATWLPALDPGDTGRPEALWYDPAGSVWAAMENAEVRTWNGTAWSRKTVGDNAAWTAFGSAENDIWIASVPFPFRNRLMHWNGTSWSEVAVPFGDISYRFGKMWGSAADNYWIAGGKRISGGDWERYLFHWNGTAWSIHGPFGVTSGAYGLGFASVWGSAKNDVYAVAPNALYHFDGTSWTQVAAVPGGVDVFGSAANSVYVISLAGTELWHWNGSAWSSKTMPARFDQGWANSATDIWLGGNVPTAMHYDGTFFVNLPAEGMPLGSATEMYIISPSGIRKWPSGFSGTSSLVGDGFFSPNHAWRAPSGRLYAVSPGKGLLVH